MGFSKRTLHNEYTSEEVALMTEIEELQERLEVAGIAAKDINPANGGGYVFTINDWDMPRLRRIAHIKVVDTKRVYLNKMDTGVIVVIAKLVGVQ